MGDVAGYERGGAGVQRQVEAVVKHVLDVMQENPPVVSPEMGIRELAELLLESGRDGYCVVEDGVLVGIVTSMDLIFQEKKLRLPTFFTFLDSVVPVGVRRTHDELRKISGATVADVMSREPVTVRFDAGLDQVASLMVERHLSLLPVVREGTLVGEITKPSVLRAVLEAHPPHGQDGAS